MSTGKNVLSTLAGVESGVTLAIELGGQLVPLATGLVREIRQVATGAKTVSYQVLIETDSAELDAIDKLSTDDLTAINAELTRLGLPPVPVPPPPAPESSGS